MFLPFDATLIAELAAQRDERRCFTATIAERPFLCHAVVFEARVNREAPAASYAAPMRRCL